MTPQRNWKGDMSSLRGGLGGWTAQQHPVASWDRCGWRPDSPRPVSGSAAHVCRAAPAVSPWPAVGRGASPAVGPVLSRPPRGCLTSPGAHLWPPAAHRSAPVLVPAPQPSSIWSLTGVWPCARAPCVGVLLPLSCLGKRRAALPGGPCLSQCWSLGRCRPGWWCTCRPGGAPTRARVWGAGNCCPVRPAPGAPPRRPRWESQEPEAEASGLQAAGLPPVPSALLLTDTGGGRGAEGPWGRHLQGRPLTEPSPGCVPVAGPLAAGLRVREQPCRLERGSQRALGGLLTCLLCLIFSQTLTPAQASVVAVDQESESFGSRR